MSAIMTSRQATELDHAFERNGWTAEMVKKLSKGDVLTTHRKILQGELVVVKPLKSSILKLAGTTKFSATTKKFVAKDHFVVDTSDDAPVKIWGLGDRFEREFLDKTEEPVNGGTLSFYELLKKSVDTPIIAELGGENKAETTLTEIFVQMKKQGNGEDGDLLTNGYANISYIRNSAGVLRAVGCYWDVSGWGVGADSVDAPNVWGAGSQVFSRSSLES